MAGERGSAGGGAQWWGCEYKSFAAIRRSSSVVVPWPVLCTQPAELFSRQLDEGKDSLNFSARRFEILSIRTVKEESGVGGEGRETEPCRRETGCRCDCNATQATGWARMEKVGRKWIRSKSPPNHLPQLKQEQQEKATNKKTDKCNSI